MLYIYRTYGLPARMPLPKINACTYALAFASDLNRDKRTHRPGLSDASGQCERIKYTCKTRFSLPRVKKPAVKRASSWLLTRSLQRCCYSLFVAER